MSSIGHLPSLFKLTRYPHEKALDFRFSFAYSRGR